MSDKIKTYLDAKLTNYLKVKYGSEWLSKLANCDDSATKRLAKEIHNNEVDLNTAFEELKQIFEV